MEPVLNPLYDTASALSPQRCAFDTALLDKGLTPANHAKPVDVEPVTALDLRCCAGLCPCLNSSNSRKTANHHPT